MYLTSYARHWPSQRRAGTGARRCRSRHAAHLERIERETKNLNQLIGQLLTLSSMEAIEKTINFEPLSLNKLVEEMIPMRCTSPATAKLCGFSRERSMRHPWQPAIAAPGNRECHT